MSADNMRLLDQIDGLLTKAVQNAQDMQQGKLKYYEDNHDDTFDIERIQAELIPTIDHYLKSVTSASQLDYAKLHALTDDLYRSRRIKVARNFLILDFSMPGTGEQSSFVYSPSPSVRSRKLMNPSRTVQPDDAEYTIDARVKKACAMRVCIRIEPNGVRGDVSLRIAALDAVLMHLKSMLPETKFDIGCFEPQEVHQMVIFVVLQGSALGTNMTLPAEIEGWTRPKSLLFLRFLSPNEQTPPLESRVMSFNTGGYNAINGNLVRARQVAERLAIDISNACGNALQTRLPQTWDLYSIWQELQNRTYNDNLQLASGGTFKKSRQADDYLECAEWQLRYNGQNLFDQRIGLMVSTDKDKAYEQECPGQWKHNAQYVTCENLLDTAIIKPTRRFVLTEIRDSFQEPTKSDLYVGFNGKATSSFSGELKIETSTGAWVDMPLHTFLTDASTNTILLPDDMDATFRLIEDALRQRGGIVHVAKKSDPQSLAWAERMGVTHTLGANVIEQDPARRIEKHLHRLKQLADELNSTFLADNLVDLKNVIGEPLELTLNTMIVQPDPVAGNVYKYIGQTDQVIQWELHEHSNMIWQPADQIYIMAKTHERFLPTGTDGVFRGEVSKRTFNANLRQMSFLPYSPQDLALRLQALLREGKPEIIDPVTSCTFVSDSTVNVTFCCKELQLRLRRSADMLVEIEDIPQHITYRLADNTFNRDSLTWKAVPGKPHLYVLPTWRKKEYVFDTTTRQFASTLRPVNWIQKITEQVGKQYSLNVTAFTDPTSLLTFTEEKKPACGNISVWQEICDLSRAAQDTTVDENQEDVFDLNNELIDAAFVFLACGTQSHQPEYMERLLVSVQNTFSKVCAYVQAPKCLQNAIRSEHFRSALVQVMQGKSIKLLFQAVTTVLPTAYQYISELMSILSEFVTGDAVELIQRLQHLQTYQDIQTFVQVLQDIVQPSGTLAVTGADHRLKPLLQKVFTSKPTENEIISCIKNIVQPNSQYISDAGLPGLLFIPASGNATAILIDSFAGVIYGMSAAMVVDKIYLLDYGAACAFTKSLDYPGLLEEFCTHSLYDPIMRRTVSLKNKMSLPVVARSAPVRRQLQTYHTTTNVSTELGPVFARIGRYEFRLSPLQHEDKVDVAPLVKTLIPKLEAVLNEAYNLIKVRSPSYAKVLRAAAFMFKEEKLSAIQGVPGGQRGGGSFTQIPHFLITVVQYAAVTIGKPWPELQAIVILILQILRHVLHIWEMISSELKIPVDHHGRIPQMQLFDVDFYAHLAAGAYLLPKLRVLLVEAAGLQLPTAFNDTRKYLVTDERNKLAVIIFRGTVPTDTLDLRADVQLALNRQSQQQLYLEAQSFAEKVISQLPDDWHVVTTGHSLGGNIAAATSHYVQYSLRPQGRCDYVVFSPGSTFLPNFNAAIPKIVNDPRIMIAFVLPKDVIAQSTQSSMYLDLSFIVSIEEENFNQLSFESKFTVLKVAQRIAESVLAHAMGNYIIRGDKLGEALTQALSIAPQNVNAAHNIPNQAQPKPVEMADRQLRGFLMNLYSLLSSVDMCFTSGAFVIEYSHKTLFEDMLDLVIAASNTRLIDKTHRGFMQNTKMQPVCQLHNACIVDRQNLVSDSKQKEYIFTPPLITVCGDVSASKEVMLFYRFVLDQRYYVFAKLESHAGMSLGHVQEAFQRYVLKSAAPSTLPIRREDSRLDKHASDETEQIASQVQHDLEQQSQWLQQNNAANKLQDLNDSVTRYEASLRLGREYFVPQAITDTIMEKMGLS